jgi:hypothetical protein
VGKFFLRFFLIVLIVAIFAVVFLSYFGIETDKFDGVIKNRANEVNQYVKLEFQKTKIHINPTKLNLEVKLQSPKILIKNNEVILSKLNLFLPLKSFLTKAISAFFNKKSDVKNDFNGKNRFSFDKITSLFLIKIFGLCNLTSRFNLVGLI